MPAKSKAGRRVITFPELIVPHVSEHLVGGGRRPKRTVKTNELWEWSGELSGLPAWLQAESYLVVGDLLTGR